MIRSFKCADTEALTKGIRVRRFVNITADTALRLGQWFGSGPEIWMDLQKDYELWTAEAALGDTLKTIPHRPERRADP